jgi:hypothetical protein
MPLPFDTLKQHWKKSTQSKATFLLEVRRMLPRSEAAIETLLPLVMARHSVETLIMFPFAHALPHSHARAPLHVSIIR